MRRSEARARQSHVNPGSREAKPTQAPRPSEVRIPHDLINEQVMIAAAIVAEREMRKRLLREPADSFFGKGHAEAWRALQELEKRGLDYDPATIAQMTSGAVDTRYLEQLLESRPEVPPNLRHHVESLHWDRARIDFVRGPLGSLLEALRDPRAEPERVRGLARQIGASFQGFGAQRFIREPAALVRSVVDSLTKRQAGQACFPFGLEGLDRYGDGEENAGQWRMIPGAAPGAMTVITGMSGSGKTTATANMVCAMAAQGRRVLFGAWEQGASATLELCAALNVGAALDQLRTGAFDDATKAEIAAEAEKLSEHVTFVEIPFGRERGERGSNDKNLDLIHQLIADAGCDVFVADLFRRALRQFEPDEEEHALQRIQSILQETNVHGMLIQQLRLKDLEQRPDKRPTREGIKGSGAWVEMPDTILGFHRPALWKDVPDRTIEAIILKQRYGVWPLSVEFQWDAKRGRIWNGRTIAYNRPGDDAQENVAVSSPMFSDRKRSRRRSRSDD